MQGVGNDFVVIDGRKLTHIDWASVAVEVCQRRIGIGADGLLVIENSDTADLKMRMFNPDGSPDVCGNGLRCVARYAFERGLTNKPKFEIETLIDVRPAEILLDANGRFSGVTVGMNHPQFQAKDIPINASGSLLNYPLELPDGTTLKISAVSTGSTHSVTFVSELPNDATFLRISPQVENHPIFPERTSLMWCKRESPTQLRIRIWERGAGETWGCGTGACAAAVMAKMHTGGSDTEPITVSSIGGDLVIDWEMGKPIQMTGPAKFVFDGTFEMP